MHTLGTHAQTQSICALLCAFTCAANCRHAGQGAARWPGCVPARAAVRRKQPAPVGTCGVGQLVDLGRHDAALSCQHVTTQHSSMLWTCIACQASCNLPCCRSHQQADGVSPANQSCTFAHLAESFHETVLHTSASVLQAARMLLCTGAAQ